LRDRSLGARQSGTGVQPSSGPARRSQRCHGVHIDRGDRKLHPSLLMRCMCPRRDFVMCDSIYPQIQVTSVTEDNCSVSAEPLALAKVPPEHIWFAGPVVAQGGTQ
jgi:hypothetical protein